MTQYDANHRLIDSAAAGLALGVSPPTIRRMVISGELTNYGTPRRLMLDLAEIFARQGQGK